ncbi:hypothetical protein DPMN_081505 [Dreissena polymorpha]|uniref:SET domain-containing protein n=1 Tax=Dreissena polymorpha TaxID=45954 RepID=A0A9D3Y7F0_DREPO|nr:hypothetical protein DPMN_081505 [Dreissena polymorpha]
MYSIVLHYRIDATEEHDSLGRLVNDGYTKPNCKVKIVDESGQPKLYLCALRDIQPAEGILYNYGPGHFPRRSKVIKMIMSNHQHSIKL